MHSAGDFPRTCSPDRRSAILAWSSLLLPVFAGLMVLSISLFAMLWADLKLATAPAWYPILRLYLSIGAIVALLLGLATS
jgi:hypothetical protein